LNTKTYSLTSLVTLIISIGIYIISLTQEAFCTANACGDHWSGLSIVAMGAIGGIMSVAGLTWYANPLLWVAWSLINKKTKKAFFFSLGATAVALSFLLFDQIADRKPGVMVYITNYRAGYWLWLASMITMVIGSFIVYIFRKDEPDIFPSSY
jgi:hypothetical protein